MSPHDAIYIPQLLTLGGLVKTVHEGSNAIAKGKVYIERWNIGVAEVNLPRWVLRGVTISLGDRSIHISDDGAKIERQRDSRLELV